MSVNITVNGKFAKHCRSHPLLNDPQEVRKAEEKERRKLRLLQVREESKKLAKKIRDEVNEEKKRELQKLQAIKEKELECWRKHALQRKGEEYREAIFQIGTAHQAAKIENEEKAVKQKPQGSYKDFKKQMAARKSQASKVQFSCSCQQITPSANKQYKCSCTQTNGISCKTNKEDEAHKRKRDLSFSTSESECEDEGYKEQTTIPQSSLSFSSTSSSFDSSLLSVSNNANNKKTQTSMFVPTGTNKCLIKTPAVYLDVEVGSEDSITISAPPAEVKDRHVEYNRQFNSVIRVSPRKGRKQVENTSGNPVNQLSSTTTTMSSEITAIPVSDCKTSFEKSHCSKQQPVTKEKRFTIISDLVKKQQENVNNQPTTSQPNAATISQATSQTITPHLSPRKQLGDFVVRPPLERPQPLSPRKTSATSKSSRVATDKTQPSTTFTATTKSNTAIPTASISSGRVQFYDYNSKLAKEREQSATAVSVQRQRDIQQPTAMEQAELEKQREREKQLEALRKSQQMEERGQKALEREQVRRDCNELTEKLEALTREYPNQVPTNDNHHLFADKQLRKEGKMNSAVEKLLKRPTIITCSEVNQPGYQEYQAQAAPTRNNLENAINLANLNNQPLSLDDVSSDSCCSILLGYVDDQSRLVKQDLQNNNSTQNQSKQKRLKNLLKRLDELRSSLIQELKNESESKAKEQTKFSSKEENLRQVIDSISEMRKEREEILINDKNSKDKPLREREKELQAKEAILEQKVREFYELQKQQTTSKSNDKKLLKSKNREETDVESSSSKTKTEDSNDKENKICVKGENPLEIIITVKGETKCVKVPQKSKTKKLTKKSPSKLATLIKSPQTKKHTPKKKMPTNNALGAGLGTLKRQNSYDSNSTSYMSLPAEIPNKIEDLAQQLQQKEKQQKSVKENKKSFKQNEEENQITSTQDMQQESETSLEPLGETLRSNQPPRINPLVAQYVQRLLGMSRKAVEKLGVSSSDIDTPGSSIINTTENFVNSDTLISEERLMSIHNFMEENRSFIKELEQSIRSQNNVSLENSMKKFDDIWRKRLKTDDEKIPNKPKTQTTKITKENKQQDKAASKAKPTVKTIPKKEDKVQQSSTANIERKLSSNDLLKDLGKTLSSYYSSDDKESLKSLKTLGPPSQIEKVDKAIDTKLSTDSSKAEPDSQIARYAKLTENCTHRIAELTELINRVRREKQRLLEVTLSSVSDNGRQSTEYLELPEGKSNTGNEPEDNTRVSSSSEETTTQTKHTQSSDTLREMPKLSSQNKNKLITASRDSGIADSRPVTAQEHHNDPEPISQTSSDSLMMPPPPPPSGRKMKPPPTLKRFSPQLPEDELAHELSTILEVDTPATSRINTAAGQSTEDRENVTDSNGPQQPIKFPTFEQYIKQLDLDVTQLDPEQSIQLQQEFTTFLECLQQQRSPGDNAPKYSEFPSIHAYIQRLADGDMLGETEESLAQLRISSIPSRNFPPVREYVKNNTSKSTPEDQQLLDTESLENITEEPTPTSNNTDNDTASLDIEAELKRRKILKNSFRFSETKKQQQIFSSTAHRDAAFYQDVIAIESGVDKLSSSGNTSDLLDQDLRRMVQQWPGGEVKQKSKEIKILSSTTTSANASSLANSALKAASLDDSSKGTGQALNLRDFLTRELLKHANMSGSIGSNSSSDDSLRSHFLHSLIGSLTPRTPGAASKSGALTLDRQKTSTPVPMHSTQTHSTTSSRSNTSSQLFSGESRLSSVHYQDRSVRFFTSDGGANTDHGSE